MSDRTSASNRSDSDDSMGLEWDSGAVGSKVNEEIHLLSGFGLETDGDASSTHELRTAPIFTRRAYLTKALSENIGQYGLLGEMKAIPQPSTSSSGSPGELNSERLYLNTDAPLSVVVCGVQGSGKSHSVSTMLESMFIRDFSPIGQLVKPLSGLVFHLGDTGLNAKPCEAAYLSNVTVSGVIGPAIRVFVSPGSIKRATRLYGSLGENVTVEPLAFTEEELDAAAFLSLMAVGSSESAPLYMQQVLAILREFGEDFTYAGFMARVDGLFEKLNSMQENSLKQRLDLLQTYAAPKPSKLKAHAREPSKPRFASGQITIIDLSDPFLDSASACGLFEIALHAFERAEVDTGKVVLVDEAHKYLSARGSSRLTNALLTVIREQRHRAMRVLISTQEPTVIPPTFLALCPVIIMHRFSSAAWWEHLTRHVAGDADGHDLFDIVVRLKTGESLMLAPTGLDVGDGSDLDSRASVHSEPRKFGRNFILVKTRQRITKDGGVSRLVVARGGD